VCTRMMMDLTTLLSASQLLDEEIRQILEPIDLRADF